MWLPLWSLAKCFIWNLFNNMLDFCVYSRRRAVEANNHHHYALISSEIYRRQSASIWKCNLKGKFPLSIISFIQVPGFIIINTRCWFIRWSLNFPSFPFLKLFPLFRIGAIHNFVFRSFQSFIFQQRLIFPKNGALLQSVYDVCELKTKRKMIEIRNQNFYCTKVWCN